MDENHLCKGQIEIAEKEERWHDLFCFLIHFILFSDPLFIVFSDGLYIVFCVFRSMNPLYSVFQIHELTLLCFQHEWTLLQIHRWTLLCFQIHECNINEALMETNMGPWPLQRLLTTKRPTLGQPLWNIFWSRILPPFSSLHCDCVSSIAIRFSPFSQSRLCFCGQFDNQRKRTSLSRTSMKLTCQKYNSPFQENLTRPGKLQFGKRAISVIRKR